MKEITVAFPLSGAWQVIISPGDHVPSHYTKALGMTYAFDFAKTSDVNIPLHRRLAGINTTACEAWGAEVVAPIDGRVVEIKNNISDRKKLSFFNDLYHGIYPIISRKKSYNLGKVFGNYVIIENEHCCCLLAHLQESSISLMLDQRIKVGEFVGKIGHSGSSQRPHLHFQLMDSPNLIKSQGIPANFTIKLQDEEGEWREVSNCVPKKNQIIQAVRE